MLNALLEGLLIGMGMGAILGLVLALVETSKWAEGKLSKLAGCLDVAGDLCTADNLLWASVWVALVTTLTGLSCLM